MEVGTPAGRGRSTPPAEPCLAQWLLRVPTGREPSRSARGVPSQPAPPCPDHRLRGARALPGVEQNGCCFGHHRGNPARRAPQEPQADAGAGAVNSPPRVVREPASSSAARPPTRRPAAFPCGVVLCSTPPGRPGAPGPRRFARGGFCPPPRDRFAPAPGGQTGAPRRPTKGRAPRFRVGGRIQGERSAPGLPGRWRRPAARAPAGCSLPDARAPAACAAAAEPGCCADARVPLWRLRPRRYCLVSELQGAQLEGDAATAEPARRSPGDHRLQLLRAAAHHLLRPAARWR
ncbi:MAG: hypothetical protein H6Q89_1063, partial [Myxococcaceae bacterium]|nr:hypothetical protein [Myxococcaceae bacterium]